MNLINSDCLEALKSMPNNCIDAIVTDPPYGINFMGRKWDYDVPSVDIWTECLRVLKPGGYLLAFAGTRTQHRMAVRIEDAGFEIRDMIAWVYGSGFPKSHDVSKAIDKLAGAEREVVSTYQTHDIRNAGLMDKKGSTTVSITAPATDAAKQWQGWGTALKPSLEPVTLARKPLIGTVADNVLVHGTGGINVDGCRVRDGSETDGNKPEYTANNLNAIYGAGMGGGAWANTFGRWPANLIHDGSDEVVAMFPDSKATANGGKPERNSTNSEAYWGEGGGGFKGGRSTVAHGDSGSASRFFYCAKASKKDRDEGLDGFETVTVFKGTHEGRNMDNPKCHLGGMQSATGKNIHPTVKPTDLMRYLCRLVTPPNGVVLDPFMGSGSTGKAAILEGFDFIGIEREAAYFEIAKARIKDAEERPKQMELI